MSTNDSKCPGHVPAPWQPYTPDTGKDKEDKTRKETWCSSGDMEHEGRIKIMVVDGEGGWMGCTRTEQCNAREE